MNSNHQPIDDDQDREARLTAYALGQLDSQERAAVEAELAASEKAREEVRTTRVLANYVYEAACRDQSIRPSPALRQEVEERLRELEAAAQGGPSASLPAKPPAPSHRRLWGLFALAACLLVAAVPAYMVMTGRGPGGGRPELARREAASPALGEVTAESARAFPAPAAEATGERVAGDQARPFVSRDTVRFEQRASGPPPALPPPGKPAGRFASTGSAATHPDALATQPARKPAEKMPGMVGSLSMPAKQPADAYPPSASSAMPRRGGGSGLGAAGQSSGAYGAGFPAGMHANKPGGQPMPGYAGGGMGGMGGMPGSGMPGSGMMSGTVPGADMMPTRDMPRTEMRWKQSGSAPPAIRLDRGRQSPAQQAPIPQAAPVWQDGTMRQTKLQASGQDQMAPPTLAKRDMPTPGPDGSAQGEPGVDKRIQEEEEERVEGVAPPGTEHYDRIVENPFRSAVEQPLSTFSIDVDTASYANVRRFLREGSLPPRDAVRIEEMLNYFPYHDPPPKAGEPFAVNLEAAQCPWNNEHRLVRIGLAARQVDRRQRGPTNLVFLLDVSGSMDEPNKLPLVKEAMKMLVRELGEDDRVAIVTYAETTGVRLESTNASNKEKVLDAIDSLTAGGRTNGGAGIQLAYEQALKHFRRGGTNRVILATDGDLNVGITSDDELVRLIRDKKDSGVMLTVLGVGTGNLKDAKLEKLADKGNGTYAYLDSVREARRVLVDQIAGTLVTIAKDVKIQVEFNPAEVARYRLIGYENRRLATRDFDDDRKDAGEIGAGHHVTALYEIVPARAAEADQTARAARVARAGAAEGQPLKYQRPAKSELTDEAKSGQLLTLQLRYKRPNEDQSNWLEYAVRDPGKRFGEASADFQFAAAVAAFGMILRDSPHRGQMTLKGVEEIAASTLGDDPGGYRAEFLDLVRGAEQLRRPE